MSRSRFLLLALAVAVTTTLLGCTTNSKNQLLATDASAVALRAIQTRAFDTTDRERLLRTAIATLQDLQFVIDKADNDLGSISATKLSGYNLRMTITIRPRNTQQSIVRANAEYNAQAVSDPLPYQSFFDAYSKALFLEAHAVD